MCACARACVLAFCSKRLPARWLASPRATNSPPSGLPRRHPDRHGGGPVGVCSVAGRPAPGGGRGALLLPPIRERSRLLPRQQRRAQVRPAAAGGRAGMGTRGRILETREGGASFRATAPRQLGTLALSLSPETRRVKPCTLPASRPQRDLKLDNTLLDGSMAAPRIKICDFGAPLGLPLPRLPLVPSREAAQRKSPAAAVGTPYACLQCGALP